MNKLWDSSFEPLNESYILFGFYFITINYILEKNELQVLQQSTGSKINYFSYIFHIAHHEYVSCS